MILGFVSLITCLNDSTHRSRDWVFKRGFVAMILLGHISFNSCKCDNVSSDLLIKAIEYWLSILLATEIAYLVVLLASGSVVFTRISMFIFRSSLGFSVFLLMLVQRIHYFHF